MRVQGISKEKNGVSAASEGSSTGCSKQCAKGCGTKARLAHKQAINQKMAERNLQNAKSPTTTVVNKAVNNNSNTKKAAPKQKSVDDVVKFIEGSSAGSDKKKMKKERQKQEKMAALKEQEEKERKLQEAIAREQQRVKEEERKRAEAEKEISQMSKKQLKKANQRAKKLAEEQGSYSPLSSTRNQASSQVPGAFGKTEPSMPAPNLSMEQLKAKHQRELEMMELKHKQALEEEYVRSMYKQNGQTSTQSQYQQPRYQPQPSPSFGSLGSSLGGLGSSAGGLGSFSGLGSPLGGLGSSLGNLGSTRSSSSPLSSLEDLKAQLNNLTTNTMNQLRSGLMKSSLTGNTDGNEASNTRLNPSTKTPTSALQNPKPKNKKVGNTNIVSKSDDKNGSQGARSSLPVGAREALAKVGKNPENQIRISRNAQGGVDFSPVPTNQVKAK